jgi:hypothetical protein
MKFEHDIDFRSAHHIGIGSQTKSVHGVDLTFATVNEKRAVTLTVFTNWMLPETYEYWQKRGLKPSSDPTPADITYHSPVKLDEYDCEHGDCSYTGGKCYHSSSSSNAQRYFDILVRYGIDALWIEMEKYWESVFGEQQK